MANPLRFGLWYAFRIPAQWACDPVALYREHLRQIAWAETIGYDDVWLTEHHFCADGHAPSILPLAAAVAATTQRIRIGTAVLLLPLHDAVRVAEDGATIDILSGGRFELGIGGGYRPQEFAGLGRDPAERASAADEGLEVIARLWRGEAVHFRGRHYHLDGVRLAPLPVQRPRPPLWVGGFAPAAPRRAAPRASPTATSAPATWSPRRPSSVARGQPTAVTVRAAWPVATSGSSSVRRPTPPSRRSLPTCCT